MNCQNCKQQSNFFCYPIRVDDDKTECKNGKPELQPKKKDERYP